MEVLRSYSKFQSLVISAVHYLNCSLIPIHTCILVSPTSRPRIPILWNMVQLCSVHIIYLMHCNTGHYIRVYRQSLQLNVVGSLEMVRLCKRFKKLAVRSVDSPLLYCLLYCASLYACWGSSVHSIDTVISPFVKDSRFNIWITTWHNCSTIKAYCVSDILQH